MRKTIDEAHQSTSKRKFDIDVENNTKRMNLHSKDKYYHKGGLVHSLHGNIYQLKLQMLFLKRALDKGYDFNLGTEVEDAEKFDDIVFKYRTKDESRKNGIRFVQAKHKQDESKKITANDLLTDKDHDFSLRKYFISYYKIKNEHNYNENELKDFILYTNIDFDYNDLENKQIDIEELQADDILNVTKSKSFAKRYRLIVEENHKVYEKLRETSDLHILAKELADHISTGREIHLRSDILKLYHGPLSEKIFIISSKKKENNHGKEVTIKYAKFRDNFLNSNDLSEDVFNFRNALKTALRKETDVEFQKELNAKEIRVSSKFGKVFRLENNPVVTDPQELARKIGEIIKKAKKYSVEIPRTIAKNDIDKLAGHILVQDEENGDLMRLRQAFFDDNNKLNGNLEDFKNALKVELRDFDALKQYKFKITNFETCEEKEGKLLLSKVKLPNDEIRNEEIKTFLEKLVFAVNQPNEVKLGDIISNELGDDFRFNLLNTDLISAAFQRKMLDWFKKKYPGKGKEGLWLNAENGKEFFDSIEQQINSLISIGLCLGYSNKIQAYDIRFEINNLSRKLENFLSSEESKEETLYIVVPEQTILCAISVYGVLEELKKKKEFAQYAKYDCYIFILLSRLLQEETQKRVLDAYQSSNNHNLLIIDCKCPVGKNGIPNLEEKILKLFKELKNLLKKGKKIIVIYDKNDIVNRFADESKYNFENPKFNDFTVASKKKLLEKKITFQGMKLSLKQLYFQLKDNAIPSFEQLDKLNFETKTLVDLIKGNEIIIGSKAEDLGEVNDYYIHRRFKEVTLDREKIKKLAKSRIRSDIFVISGSDSELESYDNIYVFNEDDSAERKFKELCDKNKESNIHWLESHLNTLTWYNSHGSIANLLQYRVIQKYYTTDYITPSRITEEDNLVCKDNYRIVIISDTAGMGKSTVLTSLSMKFKQEVNSSPWVIRINLNDYSSVFLKQLNERKYSRLKFSDRDISEVVNFLLNDLLASQEQSKLKTDLEKTLFKYCCEYSGKIALLFDGFDEISPDYTDIVIDLLQSLKKTKIEKLFVTTRPNMSHELELALGVFSHVLEPLSKQERIKFLTKFWTKKLNLRISAQADAERLELYAKSIIEHFSKSIDDNIQEFISIPLQTMMLAEVFQKKQQENLSTWQSCEEFLKSNADKPKLSDELGLLDLYEHFVGRKFNQFYLVEKKSRDLSRVGEERRAAKEYKAFKENHEILALHTLFGEKKLKKLLSQEKIENSKSLMEDVKRAESNEGIVDLIIDGKPHFIHRTFAEYFASFPIAKQMLEKPADILNCIDNFLLNASPIFINSLVEQLKEKQEKLESKLQMPFLRYLVENKKFIFLKSLLQSGFNDWTNKLDDSGKTPLHYAIEFGHFDVFEKLLVYADDIFEEDILKHGVLGKPEYANSNLVTFVNLKRRDGKTALDCVIEQKSIDLAFKLLLKGASTKSLTDLGRESLVNKMLKDNSSFGSGSIHTNNILGVYADQKNIYRPIQEKLLLEKPNVFNKLCEQDQSRILSFFFVHGRVEVIEALMNTIQDSEVRKEILNNDDNSYTPFDRVRFSIALSDDDRLKVTKYLITHGATKSNFHSEIIYEEVGHITLILEAAAKLGHIKTFQSFIGQEEFRYYGCHFHQAIKYNRRNIIEYLFINHRDIIPSKGDTALHIACFENANLKIIRYLIENGELIDAKDNNGASPLLLAVSNNSELNLIKYLVTKGADINCENQQHRTPLSFAVVNDQTDVINYLVKKNARVSDSDSRFIKDKVAFHENPIRFNLDLVDENGFSRLHTAIMSKDTRMALLLIVNGADINKVDLLGQTPLHWASKLGQVKIVEFLLNYGAVFSKKDNNNRLPCSTCDNKIIWLLDSLDKLFSSQNLVQDLDTQFLKNKNQWWGPYGIVYDDENIPISFILNARNNEGKTLLHIAADTGCKETVDILLNFNPYREREKKSLYVKFSSIDSSDFQGNTPLHLAAHKGHTDIVSVLLREGAIFNSKNLQGHTPEVLTTNNLHNDSAKLFQVRNNLVTAINENNTLAIKDYYNYETKYFKDQYGKTPLHLAASSNQTDVLKLLLDEDASINKTDLNGNTPLHMAGREDKIENVKLLLKYGAMYNVRNKRYQKPSELAHGQSRELLEHIDTLFRDVQSDLPQVNIRHIEMIHNNYDIHISSIINTRDNQLNTLLHYAAKLAEFDIVELLLECGAMFDAKNDLEETPKMLAKYQINIETLLKAIENMFENCDRIYREQEIVSTNIIINVLDERRNGLLHYAVEHLNKQAVKYLLANGANISVEDKYYHRVLDLAFENEKSDDADSASTSEKSKASDCLDNGSSLSR